MRSIWHHLSELSHQTFNFDWSPSSFSLLRSLSTSLLDLACMDHHRITMCKRQRWAHRNYCCGALMRCNLTLERPRCLSRLRRLSMKLRSALNKLQQYFYSKTWESILCKKHCIEHARSQFSRLVRRDGFQRRSHSLGKVHQHLPGSWLASCWSSLQLRHR